jgi:hypothetical protein
MLPLLTVMRCELHAAVGGLIESHLTDQLLQKNISNAGSLLGEASYCCSAGSQGQCRPLPHMHVPKPHTHALSASLAAVDSCECYLLVCNA